MDYPQLLLSTYDVTAILEIKGGGEKGIFLGGVADRVEKNAHGYQATNVTNTRLLQARIDARKKSIARIYYVGQIS